MKYVSAAPKVELFLTTKNHPDGKLVAVNIPKGSKYIAIDRNGDIYSYENPPIKIYAGWDSQVSHGYSLIGSLNEYIENFQEMIWTLQYSPFSKLLNTGKKA